MPRSVRDSGLLHGLLRINQLDRLLEHPALGQSFESFVVEEILKGLEATLATQWTYHYYRTRSRAEIDLILDGPFGVIPIEIKHGLRSTPRAISTLKRFVSEHQLPFGLLVSNADEVAWLAPTILQVPAGCW